MLSVNMSIILYLTFLGVLTLSEGARRPRMVNGDDVEDGELPFVVALRKSWTFFPRDDDQHLCGAAILNSNYVITATHCLSSYMEATTGILRRNPNSIHESVGYKISHENYEEIGILAAINDIALIKVTPPFKFNDTFYPVKLPPKDFKVNAGDKLIVAGWGISNVPFQGPSLCLKKSTVTAVSEEYCKTMYKNETKVLPTQLCTHDIVGGRKGPCRGDSGGPLVTKDNVLVGIVSWSKKDPYCASPLYPNVYTRVSEYVDWIHKRINEREEADNIKAQSSTQPPKILQNDDEDYSSAPIEIVFGNKPSTSTNKPENNNSDYLEDIIQDIFVNPNMY